METPLLSGENSGNVNRRRERSNRAHAIAHGSPYEKAAALVDLAEDGIGLPEQILEQSNFQNAAKFYFIFTRLDFIWFLNYFALIILNFLEKPLWCTNYFKYSCNHREYFYLGQLPYLTGAVSLIYEAITLIILIVHTFFPLSFEGYHLYWKSPLNRVKVACLLLLVADILVYALYWSLEAYDFPPFRISPYIRVVFFMLNFSKFIKTMSGSRSSNLVKFDVEKFDGRINFGLWQVQVKDILIQSGLHKALKGRPTPEVSTGTSATGEKSRSKMSDEDWEDLDLRTASAIRLCLAKNILANVHGISTAKELWEKLEELYQTKGVSNRVYLKEQFHTLRMSEGTTISDHLSVLNGIVAELEAIGVKIDDEDQALRLIWSLPPSYEHMKPILIHGKEKIIFFRGYQ